MSIEFRELDPCSRCSRQGRTEINEQYDQANGHLIFSAMEIAHPDGQVDAEIEQQSADFVFNGSIPSQNRGAVGLCGRRIGRGVCSSYMLDIKTQTITNRPRE